jgi:hypothetical protein
MRAFVTAVDWTCALALPVLWVWSWTYYGLGAMLVVYAAPVVLTLLLGLGAITRNTDRPAALRLAIVLGLSVSIWALAYPVSVPLFLLGALFFGIPRRWRRNVVIVGAAVLLCAWVWCYPLLDPWARAVLLVSWEAPIGWLPQAHASALAVLCATHAWVDRGRGAEHQRSASRQCSTALDSPAT